MRRTLWTIVAAAGLAVSGCQRDPLERKVSAASASAFAAWRSGVETDSGPDLRRQVGEALREIRFRISAEREINRAKGEKPAAVETVEDALRKQVDGRPLREVVQLGYELRQRRLTKELAALEDAIRKNDQLITKPGDHESRRHLDGLKERQTARVVQYRTELAAAERELEPLLKTSGRRLLEAEREQPDEMPTLIQGGAPKRI